MPFSIINIEYQAERQNRPAIINLLMALLCCLTFIGGCREKQPPAPAPQTDIEPQFWIRVLLLENAKDCTFKTASSFTVTSPQAQIKQARFEQADTPVDINISEGRITIAGWSAAGSEVIISPDAPYIFTLNGDDYRGQIKLIMDSADNSSLNVVNLVPLESYLAGVVGAEIPNYWEPEALDAQAIASRTYCLYIKNRFGGTRSWDMRKTQANQAYHGIKAESVQIWNAVNKTAGQVLVCGQADGNEGIFPAYYSSVCGGHTENSKYVFGDSDSNWSGNGPLAGVPCPYCRDVAKPGLLSWPTVSFDKAEVANSLLQRYPKLKDLGRIVDLIPAGQSDYGEFSRLTSVRLVGSTGKSDFLRAEDFRLAIDTTGRKLKSAAFQIADTGDKWAFTSGRGYGHGVGMCQCGAEALARQGKTADQILFYYYPGSKIVTVY